MTAPRTGPLIRVHSIGGPARGKVAGGTADTPSRAGRPPTSPGWAAPRRRIASRLARSTSSRQSAARASTAGGRQSTRLTGTPRARSASAKRSTPALTARSSAPNSPLSAATAASGEVASELGGQAVGGADMNARAPEPRLLIGEPLGILVGADHVRDDLERPAATARAGARGIDGGGDRPRRVGMRAVAEDHVEQHDADAAIAACAGNGRAPEARVDDRMRAAPRVLRLAEVDEPLRRVADDGPGLLAERAAREEAEDAPCSTTRKTRRARPLAAGALPAQRPDAPERGGIVRRDGP